MSSCGLGCWKVEALPGGEDVWCLYRSCCTRMGLQLPQNLLTPHTLDSPTTTIQLSGPSQERLPQHGPDALSRVSEPASSHAVPCLSITSHHWSTLPHSLEEIAKAQGMDNTITHLHSGLQPRSAKEQPITFEDHQGVWYRKVPLKNKGGKYQLVVPQSMRTNFMHYYHDNPLGCHLGQLKTLLKIIEVAWWPSVRRDVWQYIKSCEVCQKYKPSNINHLDFYKVHRSQSLDTH